MKKYLKQLKANKKGFTLIEMIVVIAIIGILAAILVPSMAGYLSSARDSRREANAKTVYTAAQAAVTSLESLTTPVANDTYTATISVSDSSVTNTVIAKTDTNNNTIGKTLCDKIKDLVGESNYGRFKEIIITVTNGAVDGISVKDEDDKTTLYPKNYTVPS